MNNISHYKKQIKNTVVKQKHLFLFFLLIILTLPAFAQNKIGDNPTTIQSGSLLELESLTKGLRLPRIQLNDIHVWTLDGIPVSGMLIFNELGTAPKGIYYWSMDLSHWIQVVNKTELPTLIANSLNQNAAVRDSVVKVINTAIKSGAVHGNNLISNSQVIKVLNGTGAVVNAAQVDLDKNQFGHLLNTSPVSDSLAFVIAKNTVIHDSIKSVMKSTTTNTLVGTSEKLTSTVNGVTAELAPISGNISKILGFDTSGKLVTQNPPATVVSNTSIANSISTTVNGTAGVAVDIINSNSLSLVNGVLSSSVNGVSSPELNLVSSAYNGLSNENGNVQLGGALTKPTELATTATNTLSITGLQNGNAATDGLLTVTPGTGFVRKLSGDMLGTNAYKLIAIASTDGQKRFATPIKITDLKKIQVYRNGINVEFTQVDNTHIDLEDQAACYVDDEIKIIQFK
jgi:hypothetical protein